MSRTITQDQYNGLWLAFLKHQTVRGVARETGCSLKTALKYVNEGDAERGWPSFKERYRQMMTRAILIEDVDVAKAHAESLGLVRTAKIALRKRLHGVMMAPEQMSADGLVSALDKLVRLEQHLLGESERSLDVREVPPERRRERIAELHRILEAHGAESADDPDA